jgi:hypothetical protein
MKSTFIGLFSSIMFAAALVGLTGCGGAVSSDDADALAQQGDESSALQPCTVPTNQGEFDFRCGAQGFRRNGVFDGDTAVITSKYKANPATWDDHMNFPTAVGASPLDGDGALVFGGSSLNDPTPSGKFRVDHISPDLRSNSFWQGKHLYRARLFQSGVIGAPILAQIVIEAVHPNGTSGLFHQLNSAGAAMFCTVASGTWTECFATVPLPANVTVKTIQVRVFGEPGTVYEGNLAIDDIAPLA